MEVEDVIELGSSDDEDKPPAPKKVGYSIYIPNIMFISFVIKFD